MGDSPTVNVDSGSDTILLNNSDSEHDSSQESYIVLDSQGDSITFSSSDDDYLTINITDEEVNFCFLSCKIKILKIKLLSNLFSRFIKGSRIDGGDALHGGNFRDWFRTYKAENIITADTVIVTSLITSHTANYPLERSRSRSPIE